LNSYQVFVGFLAISLVNNVGDKVLKHFRLDSVTSLVRMAGFFSSLNIFYFTSVLLFFSGILVDS
jgi:hypothetical protein